MTTRVEIKNEGPRNVEVFPLSSLREAFPRILVEPGKSIEQYVYPGSELVIKEQE